MLYLRPRHLSAVGQQDVPRRGVTVHHAPGARIVECGGHVADDRERLVYRAPALAVQSLHELVPGVGARLSTAVAKALEKAPKRRLPSAQLLADAAG